MTMTPKEADRLARELMSELGPQLEGVDLWVCYGTLGKLVGNIAAAHGADTEKLEELIEIVGAFARNEHTIVRRFMELTGVEPSGAVQ